MSHIERQKRIRATIAMLVANAINFAMALFVLLVVVLIVVGAQKAFLAIAPQRFF